MSAFYVGQRVKLTRPRLPIHVGDEGLIAYLGGDPRGMEMDGFVMAPVGPCNCIVRWDDGDTTPQHTHQLEPILPPGLESLEEINALYEPSPVEVRA